MEVELGEGADLLEAGREITALPSKKYVPEKASCRTETKWCLFFKSSGQLLIYAYNRPVVWIAWI